MPSRDRAELDLNEVGWWGKWVDDTVWVTKNCYVLSSEAFKAESFYNRSGFVGTERVSEKVVQVIEKEFAKKKREVSSVFVERGRGWDKLRSSLTSKGYDIADEMFMMENAVQEKRTTPNPDVKIVTVGPSSSGGELQYWTRVYLEAFYGNQRLSGRVLPIMRKVVRDSKATIVLAKVAKEPVGCAALYRSKGSVVGAYCIGTVPRFRGKGVATTMIGFMRALAKGERRVLILQTLASDSVEGFYLKNGFTRLYTKSLFQRRINEKIPSGETLGIRINRTPGAGKTRAFAEVFDGFVNVEAVRRMFGPETEAVISNLKISLDTPRGYLRVDGETGNIIMNPEYLRTGHETHLYLDVLHELAHVRQFREGKDLYDRKYSYFERPTEIEAYEVAIGEARRIGMRGKEIVEYLKVEWVTDEEFAKFVAKMQVIED